jgi:hypothetical protein
VKNKQKRYQRGTPSEFPFDIFFVCSSLCTFWVPLWYLFCLFLTLHLLSSPLISFLSALQFTPSEFPFDIFFVCSSLNKTDIKGELRRCKVKSRQKRYQRGTQNVQSEEQTKKISKGNSEGVKWRTNKTDIKGETPSGFPFDIFFVCSSLYTFWVPLWYLFCLFLTLHLLSSLLIQTKKLSKGNPEGVRWRTDKKDIKGELRRCKVKSRQKRYQRGT